MTRLNRVAEGTRLRIRRVALQTLYSEAFRRLSPFDCAQDKPFTPWCDFWVVHCASAPYEQATHYFQSLTVFS